jgi:radical SAM C-methyltransferase
MPLAAGYLKAMVLADEHLRSEVDVEIKSFRGRTPLVTMARDILAGGAPDVIAFSVLGWNFRQFSALAETVRQANPGTWVIFGGPHVANQVERVMRLAPAVDIVANGEGEHVFVALLREYVAGRSVRDLSHVSGISYRNADGRCETTTPPERIADLGALPSPFLTGAIPLRRHGLFPYDVALMETNRGCPYKCAFCYWGGAIGERVREFPRDRLRAELDLLGFHEVDTIVLCDANFGMRRADAEFFEDFIKVRERYGYPRGLETSWTKNKSQTFYDIVQRMKQEGVSSSFTLALQTLDDHALGDMARRNMRLNEWEELAAWLASEGLDVYAELIWGAPGETTESFLGGYDQLAEHVSRIAVYPLLVLPNTRYADEREIHGFLTVQGDQDDFEYVLANDSLSLEETEAMQPFLFWARLLVENLYFRHIWRALRVVTGTRQSEMLRSIHTWFCHADAPVARDLVERSGDVADSTLITSTLRRIYADPSVPGLFKRWWDEEVRPALPPAHRGLLDDVFRYDDLSRPVFASWADREGLPQEEVGGVVHYVRSSVEFGYPVPDALDSGSYADLPALEARKTTVDLLLRAGFEAHVDNHEMAARFTGRPAPPGWRPGRGGTRNRRTA